MPSIRPRPGASPSRPLRPSSMTTDKPVAALRWAATGVSEVSLSIAEEVPVALVYNGISHVVMMATPADLEAFAIGFSLSEGIVDNVDELLNVEAGEVAPGYEVRLHITARRFQALKDRRRNLTGRTGCGLCGVDSLEAAIRPLQTIKRGARLTPAAIEQGLAALGPAQIINRRTHSIHAAGWATVDGEIVAVAEDVGRHNALDKLIGRMALDGIDPANGFALVTSRCSFELVQKSMAVGIATLVAISAPTALALDMAEQAGITLVALARPDSMIVFTHGERLGLAHIPASLQPAEH